MPSSGRRIGRARAFAGAGGGQLGRRDFLRDALVGAAALGAMPLLPACTSSQTADPRSAASSRPNILVIYADDQRYDTFEHMSFLTELARTQGTTFTQARQSSPLCTPARATMLLGRTATGPNGHGIIANDAGLGTAASDSLAPWLAAAGYQCGMVGKYFSAAIGSKVAEGWDWWRALGGESGSAQQAEGYTVYDGTASTTPDVHQMDYLTDVALEFVTDADEPWFLWDCPTSPHSPFEPTPDHAESVSELEWPIVDDVATKPSWIATLEPLDQPSIDLARRDARGAVREVLDVDTHVEAIWKRLGETGRRENTTILYSSDNGHVLLEYRLPVLLKNLPYDVGARVPLVALGPGFEPGRSVDVPVSAAVDITATCLAVADAEATEPQDGVDLTEIVLDPETHADRAMLGSCAAEQTDPRIEVPTSDWIVTDQGDGLRKLIRYHDVADADRYEAYDTVTDPQELVNWANDESRLDEREALVDRLDQLLGTR